MITAAQRAATGALVSLALAACTPPEPEEPDGLLLSFEEQEVAAAFSREGLARRVAEGSPEGAWAVVADLPRPERARLHNLATGATTEAALFRAARGTAPGDIRISGEVAEALGIGAAPVPVRVVALRREPRIDAAP